MSRALDTFRFVLIAVAVWMNQHQLQIIDYLRGRPVIPNSCLSLAAQVTPDKTTRAFDAGALVRGSGKSTAGLR
jgi:hypothetical protein